nr:MAG TPA: hypothetical protein [Caudoviricetes sp.]
MTVILFTYLTSKPIIVTIITSPKQKRTCAIKHKSSLSISI